MTVSSQHGTASATEAADGNSAALAPDGLPQLGMAFWGSKALLSAVELGLFIELADGPLTTTELTGRLRLHPRGARDLFDAPVALGVLDRDDDGYHNTPEADAFLDRSKPDYIGGLFDMANDRLYPFWGSLTEALRTGSPRNEVKTGGNFFDVEYQNPTQLRLFLQAMTGVSMGAARRLAVGFPWHRYRTVIDIGCAQGGVPVQLASRHGHLSGGGFDLPPVAPVFEEHVRTAGLSDRLRFHPGDFFTDPPPSADVLVMGHILHDRDAGRLRLHRCGLPELAGRSRVPELVREAAQRTRLDGRGDQMSRSGWPVSPGRHGSGRAGR